MSRTGLYACLLVTVLAAGWIVYADTRSAGKHVLFADASAVLANTDILTTDLQPALKASVFRVTVTLPISSVFNVAVSESGTTKIMGLNSSGALNAGDLYAFDIPVSAGLTYNFQAETAQGSGIDLLLVQELEE